MAWKRNENLYCCVWDGVCICMLIWCDNSLTFNSYIEVVDDEGHIDIGTVDEDDNGKKDIMFSP